MENPILTQIFDDLEYAKVRFRQIAEELHTENSRELESVFTSIYLRGVYEALRAVKQDLEE